VADAEPKLPERRRNWELRQLESELDEVEGDGRGPIQQRIEELHAEETSKYEQKKAAHQEYLRLRQRRERSSKS
jgi:hypothetical protein